MSNAVSALQGEASEGYAAVREMDLRGMITVRGDMESAAMKKAVKAAAGVDMPVQRQCLTKGEAGAAWMSPDEMLVMVPYAGAQATAEKLTKALGKEHALVVNVSDARAVFAIEGQRAREVIAKLAPVDMSHDAFAANTIRRTRLAQAPVAFWCDADGTFILVCFRSEAQYVFDVLTMSATPGSEVGFF